MQRSLSCTHDTIKSKIFSGDQDCIGVVLFGSRPAKTDQSDFESVQVLLPLAPPSGAAILSLERLLGDHGSATFEAEVCSGSHLLAQKRGFHFNYGLTFSMFVTQLHEGGLWARARCQAPRGTLAVSVHVCRCCWQGGEIYL